MRNVTGPVLVTLDPVVPPQWDVCLDIEAQHGASWGSTYDARIFMGMAIGLPDGTTDYLPPGSGAMEMKGFVDRYLPRGATVLAHNGKYDLPGINGECMRLGLPKLPILALIDTCNHLGKHGQMFSKSLANLAGHFGIEAKGGVSRYEWEQLYRTVYNEHDPKWIALKEYNELDVQVTIQLEAAERAAGWLPNTTVKWSP